MIIEKAGRIVNSPDKPLYKYIITADDFGESACILLINVENQPDIRFQDGGLRHAMGVRSFQIVRANRTCPDEADGFGWTYDHQRPCLLVRGAL